MTLLTVTDYRSVTGDTVTATGQVAAALVDAQTDLEEHLDRPLEEMARTERCPVWQDRRGFVVYPKATPISDAGSLTVAGNAILGPTPIGSPLTGDDFRGYAEVTYTGGYTAGTLPRALRRAVAWAAWSDLHPGVVPPPGAVSVSLGDASVNYGAGGAPGSGQRVWPAAVRRWRRQRVARPVP